MEQRESGKFSLGGSLDSIKEILSFHDMKRLEAYANNLVDYHMVRSWNVVDVYFEIMV